MQGVNKNANLDLIRERLNVLDVVSTYIKLDKAGSQFRARCPFHNEKSPSFYVSPSRGSYHCFGCSEHGDIFGFVMKIEGINFKDALKLLADRAGVTLTNFKKEETSNLIDILEVTTLFFEHMFSKEKQAKEYIESRGVNLETIQKFRIGYAPNDWRQLFTKLKTAGYSDEEIISAGVCIKHEKGNQTTVYDRFRNRIMFPIMNASGKVVAFTGRVLPTPATTHPLTGGEQAQNLREEAKYVNSPETPMYHKSSILYGYNFAKMEIAKLKKVLVVEGQMDVVMAHQAGNINTVAISGTAFTPEHISIIKRFAETVTLALDTDKAGYTAMLKSAALSLENDLEVEGLKLTDKDPADMIKTDILNWKKCVENSKSILTLITEIILEKENIKPKQIQRLRKDLFPLLRVVKSPLLKESYTKEIAEQLDINILIIKQETESIIKEQELVLKEKAKKIQIPKKDILTMFAKGKAALEIFKELVNKRKFIQVDFENQTKAELAKYSKYFENLTDLKSELNLEEIPSNILEREHMIIEQMINQDEEKLETETTVFKNLIEIIVLGLKTIYQETLNQTKLKIRTGENLQENLEIVHKLTKLLTSLK